MSTATGNQGSQRLAEQAFKRLLTALGLSFALAALWASPAPAHQGDSNYRSVITSIEPPALTEGLDIEVKNFDDNVTLVNNSGKVVEILGYDDEPYVRIDPSGLVEVNLNSPSYYLNEDRFADVTVPDEANADAEPEWQEVDQSGSYSWHDHRSHYMGEGTPPQVEDESVETKVFDYSIPMIVGGQPAQILGTLTWVGSDSGIPLLPFILLGLVAIGGFVLLRVRRRGGDRDTEDDRAGEREAW